MFLISSKKKKNIYIYILALPRALEASSYLQAFYHSYCVASYQVHRSNPLVQTSQAAGAEGKKWPGLTMAGPQLVYNTHTHNFIYIVIYIYIYIILYRHTQTQ